VKKVVLSFSDRIGAIKPSALDASLPFKKRGRSISAALLLSLALHAFLGVFYSAHFMPDMTELTKKHRENLDATPTLVMLETDPENPPAAEKHRSSFLQTEEMPETKKPPENAQFESDKNTRASSPVEGTSKDQLPTLDGREKPGLNLLDKSASPQKQKQTPQPQEQRQQKTEEKQLEPQEKKDAAQKSIKQPSEIMPRLTNGIYPISEPKREWASRESIKEEIIRQEEKRFQQTAQQPPAEAYSFRQDKSLLRGGKISTGAPSIESAETPLGKYKAKIYNTIGTQWRFMVAEKSSVLSYGTTSIQFTIGRDGKLEGVMVTGGSPGAEMLQVLSMNAVRLCAPFPPFPENIKQQLGESLTLDVNFTIY